MRHCLRPLLGRHRLIRPSRWRCLTIGIFDFIPTLSATYRSADWTTRKSWKLGLGYGSVAQRLAEHGARYCGLDIADGPVGIVNHRLQVHGLNGEARKGDVLACPFEDERFDLVVAVGCFHHTGDIGARDRRDVAGAATRRRGNRDGVQQLFLPPLGSVAARYLALSALGPRRR